MKTEQLTVKAALQMGNALPYAWIRTVSMVAIGTAPQTVDQAELIEARYFSREVEVRIFRDGDTLRAVSLQAEAGDHNIEETYQIANPKFGGCISVCHVIGADEDGQSGVIETRLTGWEAAK